MDYNPFVLKKLIYHIILVRPMHPLDLPYKRKVKAALSQLLLLRCIYLSYFIFDTLDTDKPFLNKNLQDLEQPSATRHTRLPILLYSGLAAAWEDRSTEFLHPVSVRRGTAADFQIHKDSIIGRVSFRWINHFGPVLLNSTSLLSPVMPGGPRILVGNKQRPVKPIRKNSVRGYIDRTS